jgi:hypothetical protein
MSEMVFSEAVAKEGEETNKSEVKPPFAKGWRRCRCRERGGEGGLQFFPS